MLSLCSDRVLTIKYLLSHIAPCNSVILNCSRPDRPALLEALGPVFDLKLIRPVMNLSVTTNITIDFTLVGILAVVRDAAFTSTDNAWEAGGSNVMLL